MDHFVGIRLIFRKIFFNFGNGVSDKKRVGQEQRQTVPVVKRPTSEKPFSEHKVRGEKPCDEMLRKGLGEEPSPIAKPKSMQQRDSLSDFYVLELFAGTARLINILALKLWLLTKPQRGLRARSFLRLT